MIAAFPEAAPKINGQPTLRELIRVIDHLIRCAQTHETDISPLKLLFLCIPPELYANYTAEAYPTIPNYPGPVPIYDPNQTGAEHANTKSTWEYHATRHADCKTMMSSLIDRFLSLIDLTYKSDFENHRISNPNITFRECFHWFIERYGDVNELDRDENKSRMKKAWTLQDGWENLRRQMEDGQLYAQFAQSPISEKEVVDIALLVIMKVGLFEQQYEAWKTEPNQSWFNFKTFWSAKVALKKSTALRAGQFGYGMNAEEDTISDLQMEQSIAQFTAGHQSTQSTIANLTNTNAQLQQQVMFQQQQAHNMYQQAAFQQNNNNNNNNNSNGNNNNNNNSRNNNRNNNRRNNGGKKNNNNKAKAFDPNAHLGARPFNIKVYEGGPAGNYCWTHGNDCATGHNSGTCQNATTGHQRNATFQNPMGGNPRNMERVHEPSSVGRIGRVPQQPQQQKPQYGMMMQQVPMMPMQQMPMIQMPMPQQQVMPQQMMMPQQGTQMQMPMQQQQQQMPMQQQQQMPMQQQQMPMQFGGSMMQMPMCMPAGNPYQTNMQGKFM